MLYYDASPLPPSVAGESIVVIAGRTLQPSIEPSLRELFLDEL